MNIAEFLDRSCATADFKEELVAYAAHRAAARVTVLRPAPRVKVLRVLAQLLTREPELAVERVTVDGVSGCSDFRGIVSVGLATDVRRYEFTWDCQWRAQQEGWDDCFGFPDQIRAAQTFGWDCFSAWRRLDVPAAAADRSLQAAQG